MANKLTISFPQLAFIVGTRAMIGVGVGLLLSNHISPAKRRAVGLPLFIVGALSTIPIALRLFHKTPTQVEQ